MHGLHPAGTQTTKITDVVTNSPMRFVKILYIKLG